MTTTMLQVLLGLWIAFPPGALGPAGGNRFDEFDVFLEINATDGDAGFQGFLDGDAWSFTRLLAPDGSPLLDFAPKNVLAGHGLTEVRWESNEPTFDEMPLEDLLALFPEGTYTALGLTIDGRRLRSRDALTHDLPAGPAITSHEDGDEVVLGADDEVLAITWDAVTDDFRGGPLGSAIVGYIVTLEFEGKVGGMSITKELTIDVLPDTLQADVPADFFDPEGEYKIEIGAREASGNQTFTEISICVELE